MAWWSSSYGARGGRGMSFGCSSAGVPRRCSELGPRGSIAREIKSFV